MFIYCESVMITIFYCGCVEPKPFVLWLFYVFMFCIVGVLRLHVVYCGCVITTCSYWGCVTTKSFSSVAALRLKVLYF